MAEQTTVEPTPSRGKRIFDEIRGLVVTGGLMLFAGTAIGQPFIVPSGSMEPTLLVGDEIAAAKYAYGYGPYSAPVGVIPIKGRLLDHPPERGDIVVFALPRDPSETFVKRLIGLPGETVREDQRGFIWIRGPDAKTWTKLSEPYVSRAARRADSADFGQTWPVPQGEYFMLGDNRAGSCDSRRWGAVPRDSLIGPVIFTYWPPGRISYHSGGW
jgi:signal peptidase I